MERSDFIKLVGSGIAMACTGCLSACSSGGVDPAPTNLDFTLDISASENAPLQNVGGSLTKNGVIIARLSSTTFTALWRACTHEGEAVNYQSGSQNFLCPRHSSKFTVDGTVINGPATSPLRKYKTELTNNSLRVFS